MSLCAGTCCTCRRPGNTACVTSAGCTPPQSTGGGRSRRSSPSSSWCGRRWTHPRPGTCAVRIAPRSRWSAWAGSRADRPPRPSADDEDQPSANTTKVWPARPGALASHRFAPAGGEGTAPSSDRRAKSRGTSQNRSSGGVEAGRNGRPAQQAARDRARRERHG